MSRHSRFAQFVRGIWVFKWTVVCGLKVTREPPWDFSQVPAVFLRIFRRAVLWGRPLNTIEARVYLASDAELLRRKWKP